MLQTITPPLIVNTLTLCWFYYIEHDATCLYYRSACRQFNVV